MITKNLYKVKWSDGQELYVVSTSISNAPIVAQQYGLLHEGIDGDVQTLVTLIQRDIEVELPDEKHE